jgi:N-acetylglucosamine malate deacetylase 2
MTSAANFLEALRSGEARSLEASSVAVITAHPDDETIGIGAHLPRMTGVRVVHVTDGSPANLDDARMHGFTTQEAYAAARREELKVAMAVAGVQPGRVLGLGIADQEVSLAMTGLARRLAELFVVARLRMVLTHPYEGGHPDHDGTCFSVHAACALLRERGRPAPEIVEMAGYHAGENGALATHLFLPDTEGREITLPLDAQAQVLKRRLMECHATQRAVLSQFGVTEERVRLAPAYDFRRPPAGGRVWYDNFSWGFTSRQWRDLAAATIAELGLPAPPWR